MCSTRMEPAVQRPGGGGILEWFEAYADALNSGYFKVTSTCKKQRSPRSASCGLRTGICIRAWQ